MDGKELEKLVFQHDPAHDSVLDAIEIVKEFIITEQLIVYGGTAIDMALRLVGDSIYPDDLLPDLDFYSPTNVEHAYMLADLLYTAGYDAARAIYASHVTTMKVDLIDNHFIADISYQPPEVYNILPTLTFNRMRIIHPNFQRIDMHSSLAFPFDNPPKEVIFARWGKDIERFNLLAKYYPIMDNDVSADSALNTAKVPISMNKYIFGGFIAYSLLVDRAHVVDSDLTFETHDGRVDIVHYNIESVDVIGSSKHYEALGSLIPERIEYSDLGLTVSSIRGHLVAIQTIKLDGHAFRIAGVQYLLKWFLGQYFASRDVLYLNIYTQLMGVIGENPSVDVYVSVDSENLDPAREVALMRMRADLGMGVMEPVPINYYPAKLNARPTFDYDSSRFFRDRGRKVR